MRKIAASGSDALFIMPLVLSLIVLGLLGALIGSFANVVIYRLPKGESIAFPGSHCPRCGHQIKPWENIPILSWLALRGRCSSCHFPISFRYPLIEALMAVGFVVLALRWPMESYGLTVVPLLAVYAMLIMMALIDLDHFILPDSLTLPSVVVALCGTLLYVMGSGLPSWSEALSGAAIGAGILALINRLGSLVLRRFADTSERLWPVGMDQVNIAAVAGALGGWQAGLIAAALSLLVNLAVRRPLRLPEGVLYALWIVALVGSVWNPWVDVVSSLAGSLAAAGAVAVLGAFYWWFKDIVSQDDEQTLSALEEDDEPVAMGFGDVKLAAVLGAVLGWQNLLVALFLAFVIGAVGGVISRLAGGDRVIPFGPPLILGGLLALFLGPSIITWYLGLLGVAS